MNLFLDTNIFLRYFTKDDTQMAAQVKDIFSKMEVGEIRPSTSTIVLTEIIYTLESFYQLGKKEIEKHIEYILEIRNLLLVDKTDFLTAFALYRKHKQKISDCLIASQIPANYKLCTFDKKLAKLTGEGKSIFPDKLSSFAAQTQLCPVPYVVLGS